MDYLKIYFIISKYLVIFLLLFSLYLILFGSNIPQALLQFQCFAQILPSQVHFPPLFAHNESVDQILPPLIKFPDPPITINLFFQFFSLFFVYHHPISYLLLPYLIFH